MRFLTPIFLMVLLLTGGCARRISQNYYASASVGEAAHTYRGTIVSARKVNVGEAERLQDNGMGVGVGAVAGGVAGSQIGKGSGSVLAAAGGALLGGLAGAFVQDELSSQTGMEYAVQLDNGQIMTVVQGDEEVYQAGQRVLVIVSKKGRSRVVPDQSAVAPAPVYRAPPAPAAPRAVAPAAQVAPHPAAYHAAPAPVPAPQGKQFYVPQEGVYHINTH